jgi:hypothetical protein
VPDFGVMSAAEKRYLRDLARQYLEYANLPVMREREALWYAHNSLQGKRPMVVMELETFQSDFLPPLKCQTPAAREIEYNLLRTACRLPISEFFSEKDIDEMAEAIRKVAVYLAEKHGGR